MLYDGFWSYALRSSPESYFVEEVATEISKRYTNTCKTAGIEARRLFLCEDQKPTDVWRTNIRQALAAPSLTVLLDDEYFASAYCFFEWFAFTHCHEHGLQVPHSASRAERVVVALARSVTSRGGRFRVDVEKMFAAVEACFGPPGHPQDQVLWNQLLGEARSWGSPEGCEEIRKGLRAWPESLGEVSILDASGSAEDFYKGAEGRKLVQAILSARKASDAAQTAREKYVPGYEQALKTAGSLSLFCLAFDQFHDGGWGFSLNEDFAAEDEQALPPAAVEVNLIVVRALRNRLDDSAYISELSHLSTRLSGESKARVDVGDRKKRLAQCLVNLIGDRPSAIVDQLAIIVEEATTQDRRRWIVHEPPSVDDASVLEYAFHRQLLRALREHVDVRVFGGKRLASNRQARPGQPRSLEDVLQAEAAGRLEQVRIFVRTASPSDVFLALCRGDRLDSARQELQTVLQLSLLLSDQAFVQEFGEAYLLAALSVLDNETVVSSFSERAILCVMLSDLLFHLPERREAALLEQLRTHFARQWSTLQESVDADVLGVVAAMNAIGWAAFLLLCERQGVPLFDRAAGAEVWRRGEQLRGELGTVVTSHSPTPSRLREKLVGLVSSSASEVMGMSSGDSRTAIGPGASAFAESLLSRGILAAIRDPAAEVAEIGPGIRPALVGVLEVERLGGASDSDNGSSIKLVVRSADAGYARLFLAPFARRTGLRADSLAKMVRQFGGSDERLVQNIASVVVKACYLIDDGKLVPTRFEGRTQAITAKLTSDTQGVAEQDILELHGEAGGDVIVRRNVTLVEEAEVRDAGSNSARAPRRAFYQWTFCEMTAEWNLANYPQYIKTEPIVARA